MSTEPHGWLRPCKVLKHSHPFKIRVVDSVIECWGQFLIGNAHDFAFADIEI